MSNQDILNKTEMPTKEELMEVVEVKFQLQKKYFGVIEAICKLDGRPVEQWIQEATEVEVECILDNDDELGRILSRNLRSTYQLQKAGQ